MVLAIKRFAAFEPRRKERLDMKIPTPDSAIKKMISTWSYERKLYFEDDSFKNKIKNTSIACKRKKRYVSYIPFTILLLTIP